MFNIAHLPRTEASVVYAIGDVHGRLDLLDRMEAAIAADIAASGADNPLVCYLGDYIDRGPHSAQVIDRLCARADDRAPKRVFLKGNHEDRMIAFLDEPEPNGPPWMRFGGREALESYGIAVPVNPDASDWEILRDHLAAALPTRHRQFLSNLQPGLWWRDYLLVQAGLDPERPVTAQSLHDLMWIREPFLSSECEWGFKVVHGHVISEQPVFRPNRIGIDTGAYRSGCLTCLVLTEDSERLIQT